MPAGNDKRRDKRLELTLPVKFAAGQQANLSLLDGVTHNVSSGGVYFEAPIGQIGPADALSVRIAVPGHHGPDKPNLTLVGSGVVRRVDPLGPGRVMGSWPDLQVQQGVCGIALQFQQRPTIQLQSFEQFLWEEEQP